MISACICEILVILEVCYKQVPYGLQVAGKVINGENGYVLYFKQCALMLLKR